MNKLFNFRQKTKRKNKEKKQREKTKRKNKRKSKSKSNKQKQKIIPTQKIGGGRDTNYSTILTRFKQLCKTEIAKNYIIIKPDSNIEETICRSIKTLIVPDIIDKNYQEAYIKLVEWQKYVLDTINNDELIIDEEKKIYEKEDKPEFIRLLNSLLKALEWKALKEVIKAKLPLYRNTPYSYEEKDTIKILFENACNSDTSIVENPDKEFQSNAYRRGLWDENSTEQEKEEERERERERKARDDYSYRDKW
jgi:hypothetical protein